MGRKSSTFSSHRITHAWSECFHFIWDALIKHDSETRHLTSVKLRTLPSNLPPINFCMFIRRCFNVIVGCNCLLAFNYRRVSNYMFDSIPQMSFFNWIEKKGTRKEVELEKWVDTATVRINKLRTFAFFLQFFARNNESAITNDF